MGKLVVSEFVTLDGVMEDPGGAEGFEHGGWAFQFERGSEGDQYKLDELFAADALLLGRTTYEGFAAVWPSVSDEQGFAEKMNTMPKYVVSTTLTEAPWNNSTIIGGDVPDEVATLKETVAGDILVAGSGQLVRTLAEHDLVDEWRLMVYPILLGGGKRLFGDVTSGRLQVVEAKQAGEVAVLTLRRA